MRQYERQNTDLTETSTAAGQPDVDVGGTTRDPAQIQMEIERTRERMARDVDAIGQKLNPRNLAHDAVESVSYQARETGSRVVDFIRENPLPVAAVGLGVTWLMTLRSSGGVSGDRMARYAYTGPDRRRGRFADRGVGARVGEVTSHAREKVSSAATSVSERAEELSHRVSERAEGFSHRAEEVAGRAQERVKGFGYQARGQVTRARGGLEHVIEENPLAVAVGAAIFGLALGLLLPETRRENEMLGPARDRLMDRAGEAAERVKDVASDAAREVKQTVREEWTERKPELKETVEEAARNVKEQVKESASRVKEETKDAVRTKASGRQQGM
jgi:ElaB/YqjD/DUF883 family membrane-anchored ribosome-binding protein